LPATPHREGAVDGGQPRGRFRNAPQGGYDQLGLPKAWVDRYREEVPWAMCRAERMIAWLVTFADRNPEYQVWIAAGHGPGSDTRAWPRDAVHLEDLRAS
jgi:hypothetical protein